MLLRLGGIEPELVGNGMDRARYTTAVLAMLLYGIFATAGFTIFLMIATEGGPWPWVLGGLMIAFAIMLYDRMLLSHVNVNLTNPSDQATPPLGRTRVSGYVVRVLIALVTAAVVTHPLTLEMYRNEIDGELVKMQTTELNHRIDEVNTERTTRKGNLGGRIETDRQELTVAQSDVTTLEGEAQRERNGQGPTGQPGCGRQCQLLVDRYNDAVGRRNAANDRLTADLAAKSTDEKRIDGEQDAKIRNLQAHPPKVAGVLNQETALWQVLGESVPAMVRYLLVVVLFILLDIAVLLVKLSNRKSAYDLAMAFHVRGDSARRESLTAKEFRTDLDRQLRVLQNQDNRDKRRAQRLDDDDEVRHRARFHDREAEKRRMEDKAALQAAEDVFSHTRAMKRMTGEAAFDIYKHELEIELRMATERHRHELAMAGLGIRPAPGSGPRPGPGGLTVPTPPPPGPREPRQGEILGNRWLLVHKNLPKGERAQAPSEVWLGKDITGQYRGDVAVKTTVVPDDDTQRKARERALADTEVTKSAYVVEVLDKQDEGELLWMVMPYYPLGSLEWYMRNKAPKRPLRQVLAVSDHVLEALESQRRRAHGDIKATNVVIEELAVKRVDGLPDFTDLRIRVIDWGVSKLWTVMAAQLTLTVTGTRMWRAPEQRANRAPDPRSDLYAVGCLLYWLISGGLPFELEVRPFIEPEVDAIQRRGGTPESLDNLVPGTPSSVARFVTQLLSYRADSRMPGVPKDRVLTEARDRLGALAEEVNAIIRHSGTEIMVGASLADTDTDFDSADDAADAAYSGRSETAAEAPSSD